MLYDKLIELYLDYKNNYVTVEVFAERNAISIEDANTLIELGRKYAFNGPEL